MTFLRDIAAAVSLLTIVRVGTAAERPWPRAVAWFPWVGLVLGGAAWGLLAGLDAASFAWSDGLWLPRASLPIAVLVVAFWAVLTRLLHWDGLADVADAWWGGNDRERRLEIMADSATGAFGATAIVLAMLAQVAAISVLAPLPTSWPLIASAPVLGRTTLMFAAWLGKPARPGGLGSSVMGRPGALSLLVGATGAGTAVALGAFSAGTVGIAGMLLALLVAGAVPHLIAQRMGGVTGDVMGASVLVTETIVLMAAALAVTL